MYIIKQINIVESTSTRETQTATGATTSGPPVGKDLLTNSPHSQMGQTPHPSQRLFQQLFRRAKAFRVVMQSASGGGGRGGTFGGER